MSRGSSCSGRRPNMRPGHIGHQLHRLHRDYTTAWICTPPLEVAASRAIQTCQSIYTSIVGCRRGHSKKRFLSSVFQASQLIGYGLDDCHELFLLLQFQLHHILSGPLKTHQTQPLEFAAGSQLPKKKAA